MEEPPQILNQGQGSRGVRDAVERLLQAPREMQALSLVCVCVCVARRGESIAYQPRATPPKGRLCARRWIPGTAARR